MAPSNHYPVACLTRTPSSSSTPSRRASTSSSATSKVAPQRISLVPVDLDEFMHRLMLHPVGSGMIDWFQVAFTLTVLDKRPFAPPIESPPDRILNMRNACERFGVSDETVSMLEAAGFRSISLLALASIERLASLRLPKKDQEAVSTLILALKTTPLEPLYSLKKLTHKKRSTEKKRRATVADELDGYEKPKKKQAVPSFGWLDLAKKENLPPPGPAAGGLLAVTSAVFPGPGVARIASSSGGGGGCAPQKRPSNSSSGLRYLMAVVSFHPEDLLCGKRGSPIAVPSGVKRIQSMSKPSSSSETKARPQSVSLPPTTPFASPLKTNNKYNRSASVKSPSNCERPRTLCTPPPRPLPPRTPTTSYPYSYPTSSCVQCGRPMDKVNSFKQRRFCSGCWDYNRKPMSPSAFCQHCQKLMPPAHARKGRRLCGNCYFYAVGGGGGIRRSAEIAHGFASSPAAAGAFPFPCRNEKLGCQTVLPPPEIGLHERRCPFSLLQCQWPGCPFVGTYYDHARHTELYHSGGIDDRRPRGAQDYRAKRIV